eukprot:scaffold31_cov334-Pavlova_lutheri.AAC.11
MAVSDPRGQETRANRRRSHDHWVNGKIPQLCLPSSSYVSQGCLFFSSTKSTNNKASNLERSGNGVLPERTS